MIGITMQLKRLPFCLLVLLATSLHADEKLPNVVFLAVDDMNDFVG